MMNKLSIKAIILIAVSITLFTACQKEKYFFDSGTQKGTFNGSILAFLKSKPVYFDTLTRVIEIAGMNEPPNRCDKYVQNKPVVLIFFYNAVYIFIPLWY